MKIYPLIAFIAIVVASAHAQGSPDLFIKSVEMPCYPPLARAARVQGQTRLEVHLAADGSVQSANVVDGHPLFKESSRKNVLTWKFPATPGHNLAGKSIRVTFEYKVMEENPGSDRCATRVVFDSFDHVEIMARLSPPLTNDLAPNTDRK